MSTQVKPSGDRTGHSDSAAINEALSQPGECVLSGHYVINASILMTSDTTLTLDNASIRLVDGSRDNLVRNADQSVGGRGNANLKIQCTGTARLYSNPVSESGPRGQGLLFQNVQGLHVSGLTIGPVYTAAAMQFAVTDGHWSDIELAQDVTTTNQDGIDIGPGCRQIHIDSVRGRTGDDGFSIFAKNTGGNVTEYSTAMSVEERHISEIYISNISVDVGINPVRLQAGDGSRLSRVFVSNFTNLRSTIATVTGASSGVLQFGSTKYVTTEPSPDDLSEIYLDGYVGPASYVIGAESNFSQVGVNNVALTAGARTDRTVQTAIIGTARHVADFAPTFSNVTVSNVAVPDSDATAFVLSLPAGSSVSKTELVNVAAGSVALRTSSDARSIDVNITRMRFDKQLDILFDQAAGALPALGTVTVNVHSSAATKAS